MVVLLSLNLLQKLRNLLLLLVWWLQSRIVMSLLVVWSFILSHGPLFKCPQCRTNNHTFPSCPLLKNWIIKKKVRSDSPQDTSTSGAVRSEVAPTTESCQESNDSHVNGTLDTIPEFSCEEDFTSDVEFDLLQDDTDNQDNVFSGEFYPYSVL